MTEPNSTADLQAERLARLQQRSSSATRGARGGRRKQQVGRSSKIVIAGASTTAMLGLVASYAYVNLPAGADGVQTTDDASTATVQSATVTPAAVVDTTSAPRLSESVVVINSDGTLLSAPADLDPAIVQLALAEYRASHPAPSTVTTNPTPAPTTASTPPAAPAPKSVDLAVPAPPPPPQRPSTNTRRNTGSGGRATPAPAPAPQPSQSKSKGS